MTTGTSHAIGYRGQRYRVHVLDELTGERVTIYWSDDQPSKDLLKMLNKRHAWSDARCDDVVNKETGDA